MTQIRFRRVWFPALAEPSSAPGLALAAAACPSWILRLQGGSAAGRPAAGGGAGPAYALRHPPKEVPVRKTRSGALGGVSRQAALI
jgi:hypothetical protein